jgi:hypothetical protein
VPQVTHLRLYELTLAWFQLEPGLLESLEDLSQPLEVGREVRRDDNDIIEIEEESLPMQPVEDLLH